MSNGENSQNTQSETRSTADLLKSLDNYIEYAHATKRFADVGFYEDLKAKLNELDPDNNH